ncbi:hypothetical protein [Microbacterium sp.]|uniref:hypothetical protein n=1 Tax=Microbacterium sp. TaxID=51671 RepID=UPI003918EF32
MTIIAEMRTESHTIEVGEDLEQAVFYAENQRGTMLLRIHFRLARVSSRPGVFVVRHFRDATKADRLSAIERVSAMGSPAQTFARWKARGVDVAKVRCATDRRSWMEYVPMGDPVDDPMLQLELEMMIDLQSGVAL